MYIIIILPASKFHQQALRFTLLFIKHKFNFDLNFNRLIRAQSYPSYYNPIYEMRKFHLPYRENFPHTAASIAVLSENTKAQYLYFVHHCIFYKTMPPKKIEQEN